MERAGELIAADIPRQIEWLLSWGPPYPRELRELRLLEPFQGNAAHNLYCASRRKAKCVRTRRIDPECFPKSCIGGIQRP